MSGTPAVSAARQLIQLNEANPYCDLSATCLKEMHRHLEGLVLEIANALVSLSSREAAMRVALERMVEHFGAWARDHADEATAETWAALHCATAALSSPREDGWRSMDSAPKDGSRFLGWSHERGVTETVYDGVFEGTGEPCWLDYYADDAFHPTRWLPMSALPTTPGSAQAAEKEANSASES